MNGELVQTIKSTSKRWCERGFYPTAAACAYYLASTYRLNLCTDHVSNKQKVVNIKSKAAALVAGDQLLDEAAGFTRKNT